MEDKGVPGISLNDLQVIVNIIDVCTKRGAFEGGELALVGSTREKLIAFVKANIPAATEEATPESVTTESVTTESVTAE